MDFRQLVYICTVAEHKNITKAANALYISQPSLSHFIAKAEDELGVKLFDRSTTPLSLTYAGEHYVDYAQQILMIHDKMIKEFRDISNKMKGRLRVGAPRERAAYMMPLILPVFKARFPGIDVQLVTSSGKDLMALLERGHLDFVILPRQIHEKAFVMRKIYEEELLLVAAKGVIGPERMLKDAPNTVDLRKLGDLPFILLQENHAIRGAVELLFKSYRIKPRVVLENNSNITSSRLAAAGMGVAIVPGMTVKLTSIDPPPAIFSLANPPITWEVNAVYRQDAYLGVVENAFFEIASAVFEQGKPLPDGPAWAE
ncbi:LysR family transcriptional regulator [Ruminococcaceae bacterium OttesenSCG-928-A11]|nr:LysR family transcriptional regulator [Ruminococcaceae bacterium OttesenSCG-928-A11]